MTAYPNANSPVGLEIPASIAAGVTYDSGIIVSRGVAVSVWVKATQNLTLSIIQYADYAGLIPIAAATTQAITANTLTNKIVASGPIFSAFKITLANATGSVATVNNLCIVQ